MFNSFNNIFLLVLHLQLLIHPTFPKFPAKFPFVNQIVTPTPKPTFAPIPSSTPTPNVTVTLSPTPTLILTPTSNPTPSNTPTPTPTPTPTITPSTTPSPTLTPTLIPSPTITPTPTPSPSATPTPSPSATPTPSPSATPTPSISLTPEPSLSAEPTLIPSATPTPTQVEITPTPTISPTSSPTPTLTPTPTPILEVIGNDISYPQCGRDYPVGQMFGIVGVNGGIASTTNPCLASQLSWAAATQDLNINQPKVQLYVNTGNPGGLNTATWPQNNTDPQGNGTSNPYGNCDGSNSIACAWQYGWNRAVDDVESRFIPAANSAGISSNPSDYVWWLDVETTNSWRDGSEEALRANAADLEGMVAYFKTRGITPGIYSTGYQWGVIVGSLSSQSSLNGLPNWVPGASDLIGAKSKCQGSPFTSGSSIILTQFTMNNFDYDYSCI